MEVKDIHQIAKQIMTLEAELELGKSVESNENKIEEIMSTLSLEEILEMDDYIMERQLNKTKEKEKEIKEKLC